VNDTQPSRQSRRDTTREERLEVLRLLEAGDISAAEADALLDALLSVDQAQARPADPDDTRVAKRPGAVRIRITDLATGKANINLALPLGLVEGGLNVARKFAPDKVPTVESIRQSISGGQVGTIVDVVDKNERIEVIVEP
jgi:hypothetical protein